MSFFEYLKTPFSPSLPVSLQTDVGPGSLGIDCDYLFLMTRSPSWTSGSKKVSSKDPITLSMKRIRPLVYYPLPRKEV